MAGGAIGGNSYKEGSLRCYLALVGKTELLEDKPFVDSDKVRVSHWNL